MKPLAVRAFAWAAAGLALFGTFALYHRPEFLVGLADQIWSCF